MQLCASVTAAIVLAAPRVAYSSNSHGHVLALQVIAILLGALVVISIGVPWVTLGLLPFVVVFLHLRRVFLCTSRELKRLEAVSRSPVYAHYASAIQVAENPKNP